MTTFRDYSGEKKMTDTPDGTASRSAAHIKNLKDLLVGDSAQIVDFLKENDAVRKIEAMGLRRGKKITIMQKMGRGIVVKTSNSRIVITSDVAKNIEVK